MSVDITHTYIQALVVALISSAGRRVDLHHRAGGSANNLVTTFTTATTPGLSALVGQPIAGDWTLHVSDHADRDVGKLNRWEVKIAKQP